MDKKDNILFKEVNVGFAYLFIAIVGFTIAILMINYINQKVSEYTDGTVMESK